MWEGIPFAQSKFAEVLNSPKTKSVVHDLLRDSELSRDQLPYTDEFSALKTRFSRLSDSELTDNEFWRLLTRVGKRGGLARSKSRKKTVPAPPLKIEHQLELLRLLPDGIGSRDQLPYTEAFDNLHRQFSKLTKTDLDKREFWRVLSRAAKRSRKPQPVFESAPLGGLPTDLVHFLERQNPWWSGKPARPTEIFRRWAFREVMQRLEDQLTPIVAIRGPRQVGKTTIQEQLIDELLKFGKVNPARIMRIQFDDVPALGSFKHPIHALVRWFETNVLGDTLNTFAQKGEPVYLFFDEVQNLRTWAPQLKSLVDHAAAKTIVTGSSALRIGAGQDSLAGRISMIELGPLRLSEIAGVRKLGDLPPFQQVERLQDWVARDFWLGLGDYGSQHAKILLKAFEAYSDVGGYPACHKPGAERSTLSDLIKSIAVERTLMHDLRAGPGGRMRDSTVLKETFRRVCRYAGQAVRAKQLVNEVVQVLGSGVKERSIADAINFLANAMLIHEIPPMEALTKRQAHPPKLCLCDHFIREAWLQERVPIAPSQLAEANEAVSTTAGHIIESDVGYFLKGIPGSDLSWFPQRSNEPEIDFILTLGLQRIPIEVKYRRGKPKSADLTGMKSFCRQAKYNGPFGLLLTQDFTGLLDENIVAIPAYAFLALR